MNIATFAHFVSPIKMGERKLNGIFILTFQEEEVKFKITILVSSGHGYWHVGIRFVIYYVL
jgi:predicted MPP superfamily phosphohydrolase